MVNGLPDRPLSYLEVENLNRADAVGFVLPATPESIQDDENNGQRIVDLLITSAETVSAVVYDEAKGWSRVAKTEGDAPKDEIVKAVIEHREYDIDDEEKTLEFVSELYETKKELAEDAVVE